LEDSPYPVRGLIGFGANLLLAHGDPVRGRAALAALDFYAHADMFMTPTAALADIVLPVASCFEREALKIGFEISAAAQSHVQLRQAIVPPPGEARSDIDVVLGLAARLGTGVLTRIVNGHPNRELDQLLPWAYRGQPLKAVA
jgi:anaerobic selenocysteine-containing dehydrogenase